MLFSAFSVQYSVISSLVLHAVWSAIIVLTYCPLSACLSVCLSMTKCTVVKWYILQCLKRWTGSAVYEDVITRTQCYTVFQRHDDDVGWARTGAPSVIRLYVDSVRRVLVEPVKLAALWCRVVIVGSSSWDADVEIRRAGVGSLVTDVITDQSAIVMQQRRTLQ